MNDHKSEIFYLLITSATEEYAKEYGAQFDRKRGWYVVGEVPVELEEFLIRSPRKRTENITVYCPQCGGQMKLKKSRAGNIFWSCMLYPKCRGSRNVEDTGVDSEAKPIAEIVEPKTVNKNGANVEIKNGAEAEIAQIVALALKELGSNGNVEAWFSSPKVALNGKRPFDVIRSAAGRKLLLKLLREINK